MTLDLLTANVSNPSPSQTRGKYHIMQRQMLQAFLGLVHIGKAQGGFCPQIALNHSAMAVGFGAAEGKMGRGDLQKDKQGLKVRRKVEVQRWRKGSVRASHSPIDISRDVGAQHAKGLDAVPMLQPECAVPQHLPVQQPGCPDDGHTHPSPPALGGPEPLSSTQLLLLLPWHTSLLLPDWPRSKSVNFWRLQSLG